MKTQPDYPSWALEALIYFLNTSLPYPINGASYMDQFMKLKEEAFLQEVDSAVKDLPPEALPDYAKWLNTRMRDFHCLFCKTCFDPNTETWKITEIFPPLNILMLSDRNPELYACKCKLCHQTITTQKEFVASLVDKAGALHPELKKELCG